MYENERHYEQDEDYGEDDDMYGDEDGDDVGHGRAAGRMLSPEQEELILKDLTMSAQRSKEFLKVLSIL